MPAEQIPILMYHSIDEGCSSRFRRFTVDPSSFRAHVQYLSDNGYQTVTVSELIEAMDGRAVMPCKPVVLTFDDGFADFHEAALPILINSGPNSNPLRRLRGRRWLQRMAFRNRRRTRRMVTWSQLEEIRKSGVESALTLRRMPPWTFYPSKTRDKKSSSRSAIWKIDWVLPFRASRILSAIRMPPFDKSCSEKAILPRALFATR